MAVIQHTETRPKFTWLLLAKPKGSDSPPPQRVNQRTEKVQAAHYAGEEGATND